MKQASPRFNFFSLLLVLMPKKVKENWWMLTRLHFVLGWSDRIQMQLICFFSFALFVPSLMCFYSLFVPAVQGCTCIGFASSFKIKCSNPNAKKRYASNLCLQIKCSNAADQGVHILHRALHQAIISFSNLIKLKTLWSKTYLVIIVSVFKVGWKVRCWKVCSITTLSWTGFAWSKVH